MNSEKAIKIEKIQSKDGFYGPLEVCRSAAGYYIGRIFHNIIGYDEPGSRESGYFATKNEAEVALKIEGFEYRNCGENSYLYGDMT
jgi:hypothetical protein